MVLTRPIPQDTRDQLNALPEYHRCNVPDANCSGNIQWHHHATYQGKRIDDAFGIIAICDYHHDHLTAPVHHKLDAIMMGRVDDTIRAKYPKKIWPYSTSYG